VVLGAGYEGVSVGRDDSLMGIGVESDDDPFGSGASAKEGGSSGEEEEEEEEEEGEEEGMGVDGEGEREGDDEDEDIDSDEAFGEGDGERFKGFSFRGSKKPSEGGAGVGESMDVVVEGSGSEQDSLLGSTESGLSNNDDVDGLSEMEDIADDDDSAHDDVAEMVEDDEDEDEDEGEDNGPSKDLDERAELRKMMAEEQKAVASTISQAAKADVDKGNAVKHQRSTFDSLLNTRIRLQKSLIATNSIPALQTHPTDPTDNDAHQTILAAQGAAIKLWSQLDTLRHTLNFPAETGTKRKRSPEPNASTSTLSTTLWRRMQTHESASLPTRRSTLEKWSARLRPVSALSSSRKLVNPTPTAQPLTAVLDHHLSDMSRLVARTHIPRSCAPLQAQAGLAESPDIYDDADFYTFLLRELVDQRMANSASTAGATSVTTGAGAGVAGGIGLGGLPRGEGRMRKKVDTKASKGRKMRYTVHEKLQNFMASEDRGMWGERQRDELFGGLLGRRGALREDAVDVEDGDLGREDVEEEGLRLFRS